MLLTTSYHTFSFELSDFKIPQNDDSVLFLLFKSIVRNRVLFQRRVSVACIEPEDEQARDMWTESDTDESESQ